MEYCSSPIYVYYLRHIKFRGIIYQPNKSYVELCPTGVSIFDYLIMGQLANIGELQPVHGKIKNATSHFRVITELTGSIIMSLLYS